MVIISGVPIFRFLRYENSFSNPAFRRVALHITLLVMDSQTNRVCIFVSLLYFCQRIDQLEHGYVFDGVFLCCPFCHKMSWMRYGT